VWGVTKAEELVKAFTALLFLYGQDLAPFRMFRGLSAFHRACLSTPLYKNNPLMNSRIDIPKVKTQNSETQILFFVRAES
jgi:hypothetical protein